MNTLLLVQARAPSGIVDLILRSTPVTQVVLGVTAVFSIASWIIILWKWGQFRRLKRQGRTFFKTMQTSRQLSEAYNAILRVPDSPFSRLLRQGVDFFEELRPGALKPNAPPSTGLSEAQLQALRLVLEKEEAEEQDAMAAGLVWLAVIGVISPLLGLLGTVIGVMDAFMGISRSGVANISAVAPGISEALVTTVAGLGAAIPAVIAYNYFASRLNVFRSELEGFSSEFIGNLAREGRV